MAHGHSDFTKRPGVMLSPLDRMLVYCRITSKQLACGACNIKNGGVRLSNLSKRFFGAFLSDFVLFADCLPTKIQFLSILKVSSGRFDKT